MSILLNFISFFDFTLCRTIVTYLKSLSIDDDLAVGHIGLEGALADALKHDGLLAAGLCAGVGTAPPWAGAARALAAVSTVTLHRVRLWLSSPVQSLR
jgi:hypothetical protein